MSKTQQSSGSASSSKSKMPLQCASCKCPLGARAGVLPFFVDDHAAIPGEKAKKEPFCPQCFVYVRSPREPRRFIPGRYVALKCVGAGRCGLETVAIGTDCCANCGSRIVVVLPPKPGVV